MFKKIPAYIRSLESDRQKFIFARTVISVTILFLGILIFAVLSLLPRNPRELASTDAIITLSGVPINLGPVQLSITGLGKVQPVQSILISAEVMGRVVSRPLDLKPGVLVEKGQVLLEIDKSDYDANLKKAEADIRRLKSEIGIKQRFIKDTEKQLESMLRVQVLQRKNFERINTLMSKQASYQTELERTEIVMQEQNQRVIDTTSSLAKAKIELDSLDAQLKRAEAEEKIAGYNISRCTVASPISARIKEVFVDNDEYVNPGAKLYEIADDSRLEIPVSLNAGDVAKILDLKSSNGSHSNWFVSPAGIPVEIEWLEAPDRSRWRGEVLRLDKFDAETGTFNFMVSPVAPWVEDQNNFPLVEGMFCRVTFFGRKLDNAMKIPWQAVQLDGDVYVVDTAGLLAGRKVEVYCSSGEDLVVTGGLRKGEVLVVQKLPRGVVNGMKINPMFRDDKAAKSPVPSVPVKTVQGK